jgi:hypothetical protein
MIASTSLFLCFFQRPVVLILPWASSSQSTLPFSGHLLWLWISCIYPGADVGCWQIMVYQSDISIRVQIQDKRMQSFHSWISDLFFWSGDSWYETKTGKINHFIREFPANWNLRFSCPSFQLPSISMKLKSKSTMNVHSGQGGQSLDDVLHKFTLLWPRNKRELWDRSKIDWETD